MKMKMKMGKRFTITMKGRRGETVVRKADHVVEAWDWYAYFSLVYPQSEIEIIDREEVKS
jgi:hypothetical protein